MIHEFDFHPDASAEFNAAIDWYDSRDARVGATFVTNVQSAIAAALEAPDSWAVWPGWTREPVIHSKGVRNFPYRIVYFVHDERLIIIAVAHTNRRPGFWQDRFGNE